MSDGGSLQLAAGKYPDVIPDWLVVLAVTLVIAGEGQV